MRSGRRVPCFENNNNKKKAECEEGQERSLRLFVKTHLGHKNVLGAQTSRRHLLVTNPEESIANDFSFGFGNESLTQSLSLNSVDCPPEPRVSPIATNKTRRQHVLNVRAFKKMSLAEITFS